MMCNKVKTICLLFSLGLFGCLDNNDIRFEDNLLNHPPQAQVDKSRWVDITLSIGRLSSSGKIEEFNEVGVDVVSGIQYFQVIAKLNYFVKDYEFLRVIFTSDRMEWVNSGFDFYESESDCDEAGEHCDLVVPAEGVSGVFFVGEKLVAITNSYCLKSDFDYQYTVYAYVIDISGPEAVIVSDLSKSPVSCLQF